MCRTIKKNKSLNCGCCGERFKTWEMYQDQDQDDGYGICHSCQEDIKTHEENEYDKLIDCLKSGLNPSNLEKYNVMDRDTQKSLAYLALEDGIIELSIRRSS